MVKLTCLPEKLRAALEIARKPVKTNSPIMAIAQVCLRASGETLTLSGTDLRWVASASLPVKIEHEGAVTLAPKALADVLDACPDGEPLTLDVTDKHRATLTCGRATVRLVGGDPEEFPPPPFLKDSDHLTLTAALLRDAIDTTAFAAARDESRPVLAGVLFSVKDGALTLAAADGYRLAVRTVPLPPGSPDLTVIVPAGPLQTIGSALPKTDDLVTLAADDSHIQIESSSGTWTLARIEGDFPDFNRIIPRDPATQVTCLRADLERAINLALSFEEDFSENGRTNRSCLARLTIEEGELTVRSSSDHGDQEGTLTIQSELAGPALVVGFNGGYLRDAVRAISSERVVLELVGPASPAVLHEAGPRDGHLQICMPMHVARP
jgi:DNA polymerase-3 subunit beta